MNTISGEQWKGAAIALAIGLVSALATLAGIKVTSFPNVWLGFIFGAGVVALIWFRTKKCTRWFALAVIGASTASYFAAIFGTLNLSDLLDQLTKHESSLTDLFGTASFSVAGFIGAFLLNLALLLLLTRASGLRAAGKAAVWACAGAGLGCVAALASGPIGTAAAAVFGERPGTGYMDLEVGLPLYSVHVVWPTGMAFLILLMLAPDSGSIPHSPGQLTIFGRAFFSCVLITLAIVAVITIRDQYRSWQAEHIKAAACLRYNPLTSRK